MRRVVVTGATRGLGLEFARFYARSGDAVVATGRNPEGNAALCDLKAAFPDRVHTAHLDVTDADAVSAFGQLIESLPVDILINNAGVIGPEVYKGESGQTLETLEPRVLHDLFSANAVAPLLVTRALLPSLSRHAGSKVFVLGTSVGIAAETFPDYYGYAMSKAAVHIGFAALAKELSKRGIAVGILSPGWVRTDLGGAAAALSPDESVAGMARVIDAFGLADSGRFFAYDGTPKSY
ncbi:SDR family oxidoreductase [Azospirillum sp. B4]|uniref:SDR family oxidoreductase n=1 Tax=Azospirillum sp. B4 TaxID=95605 RepID=UPI0005CA4732|nr:SDR family oxidoreductase [Azospirillum sp. B4]